MYSDGPTVVRALPKPERSETEHAHVRRTDAYISLRLHNAQSITERNVAEVLPSYARGPNRAL